MDAQDLKIDIEILKLLISALTPIIVLIIGLSINKRLKLFEHRQWKNQKLIEKRLEIYSEIFPLFNDLLCYYTYVGNWKELSPCEIIKHKREIDRKINLAKPVFGAEFINKCNKFIDLCFKTNNGWGEDARLRTKCELRQGYTSRPWENQWEKYFCEEKDCSGKHEIRKAYDQMMNVFSKEIGLEGTTG